MSDLSSGGDDSPSATVSPHQSLMSDCTTNDQVGDDEYALTKHLSELELDRNSDDKQREIAGDSVQRSVPVALSVQASVRTPSMPRYIRPMREIPPRFRRLLAAEVGRVVKLCHRLNGSPLYSAATPSDGVRQLTNDSRATSSDTNQAADIDKPLAGQTSYSAQSPLIYVNAQSSGMPVYPVASGISVPLNGYSHASEVEPTSYLVPVGVADASLQGCGNGLPTAPEALPPSTPMLLANPVFYYSSGMLPPADVGSPFSYVIQSPVVGGCPQPGPVETGGQSAPGYARDAQTVAADSAAVGMYQSSTNNGCSNYCYNSSCPELLHCCSLQMMQA